MKDIRYEGYEGFFEKNDLNGGDDLRQFKGQAETKKSTGGI